MLARFQDKNLFIAICTKKERVLEEFPQTRFEFVLTGLRGQLPTFAWKTSDWIIQEIGVALGLGLKVILLLETGVRRPGALQGNLEHIEFDRNSPEECFTSLLQMIGTLPPFRVEAQAALPATSSDQRPEAKEPSLDEFLSEPKADWIRFDYEFAAMRAIVKDDEQLEQKINGAFLASPEGRGATSERRWKAWLELCRIRHGKGNLTELQQLARLSEDSSDVWGSLAAAYEHFNEFGAASEAYRNGAKAASETPERIRLLGSAALACYRAGKAAEALALMNELRGLRGDSSESEVAVLHALKDFSETSSDEQVLVGSMERLLEIDPSDIDRRFVLAFKYSELGFDDLSALHYWKIPKTQRTGTAWNNLGVAFSRLGLPISAISAYREAEKAGETLAMSNVAGQLLEAGFLPEATQVLEAAATIPGHDKAVDARLGKIKEPSEEESGKQKAIFEKARPVSEFYRDVGRALAKPLTKSIAGRWRGPNCDLSLVLEGGAIVATGTYEPAGGLGILGGGLIGSAMKQAAPIRFKVEYTGLIQGMTIVGTVSRRNEGESNKRPRSLLGDAETMPAVLMWVADGCDEIRVCERSAKQDPHFYSLKRI